MNKSPKIFPAILAIAIGLVVGVVDFNNDEPFMAVFVLALGAGVCGFFWPRLAWLCGLICGIGIPIVYLASLGLGHIPKSWAEPNWYATFLAIIPALIGAYWGFYMRKIFSRLKIKSHENQLKKYD